MSKQTDLPRTGLIGVSGAGALAVAVLLAACGGSAQGSPPAAPATGSPTATPVQGNTANGGGVRPGAYGQIAALSATTMQVQNSADGQVAVTYTKATTFTQTVPASRSALVAGSCVVALGQPAAQSGTSAPTSAPTAAPSSPSSSASFTAATIQLSQKINGSCAVGPRGGSGFAPGQGRPSGRPTFFGSGRPTAFPSGLPSGLPSGATARRGGFGDVAAGEVSAVTGTGVVVSQPATGDQPARQVTVTVDTNTEITKTAAATARSLAVGKCIVADGSTSTTGAVTATRIAISDAGATGCDTGGGFGRGFGGRFRQQGQQPAGGTNGG